MAQDFSGAGTLSRALSCLQGGNYPAALQGFESFLSIERENTAARQAAARAAEAAQDWQSAARHWLALHTVDPTAIAPVRRYLAALFRLQDWEGASAFCDAAEVLRRPSHRGERKRYLCRILLEQGDKPAAHTMTREAIETSDPPGNPLSLAEAWLAAGHPAMAHDIAERSPASDSPAYLWLKARVSSIRNDWAEAEALLNRLAIGPYAARARLALARNATAQQDSAAACRHYALLRQENPSHPEAVAQLARAAITHGDSAQAIALLEDHGAAIDPALRTFLSARAQHAHCPGQGREVFGRAIATQPGNADLRIAYVRHLREIGAARDAEDKVDDLLSTAPENVAALRLRLHLLKDRDAPPEHQLAAARAALSQAPRDPGLLNTVGGLLAKQDREAAAGFYRDAVELAPHAAVLWRNGVYHTWMCNRVEDARSFADLALERLGAAGETSLADIAWIEQAAGRLSRALRLITRAVRAQPTDINTVTRAVEICMDAGSYARAWTHLATLERLQPERRSPEMAMATARCMAAFRAVERASGAVRRVPSPIAGRFPDRLFDAIAARAKPNRSTERRGIMVLTSNFGAGGAERQVTYSMQGLAARASHSETVTLVVNSLNPMQGNDFFLEEIRATGVEITELAARPEMAAARDLLAEAPEHAEAVRTLCALPPKLARVALPFFVQLVQHKPRVVHLWQDSIIVAGGMAAMLAGVERIVLCTRSTRPSEIRRYRRFLRAGYRALDRYAGDVLIVNNSANGARDYEDWLGLPKGNVGVFYNGYDFTAMRARAAEKPAGEIRRSLGIPQDAPVIGGVMRFSSVKRPDLWVNVVMAAARMRPDLHGIIVGDGPMRADLKARVECADLADRIHFVGRQSPVEPWMKAMDLLFLSSVTEGLPNVLIEMQAMGRPVVTMDVGGAAETLRPGITGLTLNKAAPDVLARGITDLLADPSRMKTMGSAARKHVEASFGLSRMMSELDLLYGSAAKSLPCTQGTTS